mgnify:CR=1 FL=1
MAPINQTRAVVSTIALLLGGLVAWQVIKVGRVTTEGMKSKGGGAKEVEYSEYDMADPDNVMILAKKNAGNIRAIRDAIGNMTELKKAVDTNKTQIAEVQTQVNDLAEAQNSLAGDMVGTEEPDISGI